MAYQFASTDPYVRCAIGAFNGYTWRNSPSSGAALFKINSIGVWRGITAIDTGTLVVYVDDFEMDNANHLSTWDGVSSNGTPTSVAAFTDTSNWMIVGYTWDGTLTGTPWVWRWKIGAGSWNSEAVFPGSNGVRTAAIGSGYRHVIGNEPALNDDGRQDIVCVGKIKSNLSQATFEALTLTDIASWDAVFTGSTAWLIDFETIGSRIDRTGNGGNEINRNNVSLVSDPAGFSWGGAEIPLPVSVPGW